MGIWVSLSTYLIFIINFCSFKLFNVERAMQKVQTSVKHTNMKSPDKEINFSFFKKRENKKRMTSILSSRHTKFLRYFNIIMTLRSYMDVESTSKKPRAWWAVLFDKIETTTPSETLGKRTIVLHEDKLDEKIHVDKSSKYANKGNLTTILYS